MVREKPSARGRNPADGRRRPQGVRADALARGASRGCGSLLGEPGFHAPRPGFPRGRRREKGGPRGLARSVPGGLRLRRRPAARRRLPQEDRRPRPAGTGGFVRLSEVGEGAARGAHRPRGLLRQRRERPDLPQGPRPRPRRGRRERPPRGRRPAHRPEQVPLPVPRELAHAKRHGRDAPHPPGRGRRPLSQRAEVPEGGRPEAADAPLPGGRPRGEGGTRREGHRRRGRLPRGPGDRGRPARRGLSLVPRRTGGRGRGPRPGSRTGLDGGCVRRGSPSGGRRRPRVRAPDPERARLPREAKAAEALQGSQARLHAITESAQDAILMMDGSGNVSYWNPAAERILGYSAAEVAGRNLHDLIAPQRFHAAHLPAYRAFLETGEGAAVGKTLELTALHKDGREIAVALSLSAVRIEEAWHAVGILRDITEKKRTEEELQQALEERAETNERLEAASALAHHMAHEAEAASLAKSQFLANMSHEIRTPMNGVLGMTGLLLDSNLTEEQRRFAGVVRSSAESLLAVINDILDFSKIEAGKLDLEELDFDLRTMLEDVAEMLAVRAQDKDLELICRIDPEMPTFLRGDPGRLRQILVNLIGNAIKFTPKGEVVVEAAAGKETEATLEVRFEVRDTGIGIPQAKLGVLFSAFQQVDASTTRQYGGTGLGLAICKRLAHLMGGEVGVTSVEGEGSSFWFSAFLRKQEHSRGEGLERADVTGVRILAVDDNASNRLVLSEQLSSWGVRHEEAAGAEQALRMLRAAVAAGDPFRIVITDMQMPVIDGETLGREIKADPALRDALLVMMTSVGLRGDARRLEEIGFSAYLTKPVKQSQLHDCLATVLGRSLRSGRIEPAALLTRHALSEARRRSFRILLAEDNTTNQQVALRILEKLGYRAEAVANGREAVLALQEAPYDLVFMDVQMPVMDGFEATRAIRSGTTRLPKPGIPIIAMTAHAMKGDRERCLAEGMDDYVSKPIVPAELLAALEKWLPNEEGPTLLPPAAERATSAAEALPVFDRAGFENRLMGDAELIVEITRGFLEDVPLKLAALGEAVRRGDPAEAGRLAHALRGACANVGAVAMSAVAGEVEAAGAAGRAEKVAALVPDLEAAFSLLLPRMQELLR
ncbi:MAG: response regulator [Holophagales bacterium]|nr:response regulator [Holophagales bacterium]